MNVKPRVKYEAKYSLVKETDGYKITYLCALCDYSYTASGIEAESVAEAVAATEPKARRRFNGCSRCGRWVCDEHFNMDELVCTLCAVEESVVTKQCMRRGVQSINKRTFGAWKRICALTSICLVVVAIAVGASYAALNKAPYVVLEDEPVPQSGFFRMDDKAKPYISTEAECLTGDDLKILTFTELSIPAETKDVKMPLFNPASNPCYLVFELALASTDEILYVSGMVEPGMCVEDVTLLRGLPSGKYAATLRILAYALEDFEPMKGTETDLILTAK